MGDLGTVWAVAAQFVLAGFMGALWFQHLAFWRADRGTGGPFWLMLWSAALTMLFFVNALLAILPTGTGTATIHFIRAQILQSTVLLALPVVKSFTQGRQVRWWVAVAGALFVGRAVLWLTTDLIWVHGTTSGLSQNGRHLGTTFLAPLIVVALYVATSTNRMPANRARLGLKLASAFTLAGLFSASLVTPGPGAELLKGAWALPLVAALHLMGQQRLRSANQRAERQRQMRDALTEIRYAAWLTTDPAEILQLAQETAREQVGDETLIVSMGPGARGQFSATVESTTQSPRDDAAEGFLEDLSAVVSVAAERLRLADNLREEALTDYLTRLPNRKALELHLKLALVRAERLGSRLAVLYCDVDEFKRENDQHGHAWGDELLRRIGGHLGESLRKGTFVARVGGDEFVVVIEDAGSREDLVGLANRIRSGLKLTGTLRIPPLLSVGVAVWDPQEGTEAGLLLHEADAAMFEGKRSAGGVVMFDEALRAQMAAEQSLGREIDAALRDEELELHYQPIVDARTLEIVGLEALIRWPQGDGMRMPAQWIPFAEKTGQIVPIGRWVVVAARAAATRFHLPVAVNVAARQLAEPQFVEHLREDWGQDDWSLLTLEITESDLLDDLSHAIESLTAVRALGARISIDDFGTGHSSFARLANLPVDVLKIDKAFVRDLGSPGGVAIVQAIHALADAYGLDIVAEGVERIEQLELLTDLGIPHLQGYLLGRPSLCPPAHVDLPAASPAGRRHDQRARHRDQASVARDLASEQRDRAAEQRDRVAELDEALTNMESVEVALRRAAVARLAAAADRRSAALDRRAAASERDLADELTGPSDRTTY
ncbi:MAG: EAL domain-containing protein [Dermatophilaceae bacterium]